ncbi:MAG: GNAT family N-acetyltransferase [Acidobacteriota bacterium]|nr:GNAT family N-acetyltransferase [Acidobacteriota bacterium]
MQVEFRQIEQADFDFLWRLHNAALKDYVTKTWGWDENWQRDNFARTFTPFNGKIIVVDGKDAGYLWVIEKEFEILLASIRLLPEYQNHGIGSKIIRDLLEKSQKSVRLQVLKVNPARRLYERLGFRICDETATHFILKTNPKQSEH